MLVRFHGVTDQREVDKGELVDMLGKIAFKHEAASTCVDESSAGSEIGGTGEGGEIETDEIGDVGLGCC